MILNEKLKNLRISLENENLKKLKEKEDEFKKLMEGQRN